jgi:hypothetical protein
MALSVVNPATGTFDPTTRDSASLFKKLAHAVLGAGTTTQSITAQNELLNRADFKARAKTTDSTAASQVIDLTDEGVTFPAATLRKIKFTSLATTDNDTYFQEWEQMVWGNDGTTPKLVGSPRLIQASGIINGTTVHYGLCHAVANFDSSDTAVLTVVGTSDTTGSTAGSSIGNVSTNTATLTHPIARNNSTTNTVFRRVLGVNASSDVATNTEGLYAAAYPINATTMSIYTYAIVDGAADGFDDDGRLECSFFILPPPSVALVMSSNNVEIHVGHDTTDDVYHNVEVFIGPAVSNALTAD